ncbi:MAG: DUF2478 domain-containing protein, partial [Hyphomicrobiaceae bacterium]
MVPSLIAKQARLAAIVYRRGFEVDALLLDIHRRLRAAGRRLGGIIQASYGDRDDCASSVRVVDLASGQDYDIWQDRGACARGCRLDERGLLEAEPVVLRAIDA